MGVKIKGRYIGGLAMQMIHDLSGTSLETDPPRDNGGEGKSFSPTDLLATAVGSCMMSVMALAARKEDLNLSGMSCEIEKHMSSDLPRRVVKLDVLVSMPKHLASEQRAHLEQIGNTCPVIQSLSSSLEVAKHYVYA